MMAAVRRLSFVVHLVVTTLLALMFASATVQSAAHRSLEIGGDRTADVWCLPVILELATLALAVTAWSSLRLLSASPNDARITARWALRCAVGMVVVGPAVSLLDVLLTGSWAVLGIAVYAAAVAFVVCGAMVAWQMRHINRFVRATATEGAR